MQKKFQTIIAALFLVFFYSIQVEAKEWGTSVVIRAVKPANQQSEKSYFDLLVAPNTQQVLTVEVENITNDPQTIKLELANATTENSGIVNYQKNQKKRDSSLKIGFTDIATLSNSTLSLEGNTKETVAINLAVPNKSFKGIILGGITAKLLEEDEATASGANQTMGVQNTYSYSLAAMIYQTTDSVEPAIELTSVKEGQVNYRNYILANIQNSAPTLVKGIKITTEVLNNKGKVVYTSEANNFSMAPNSNFDYGIDLHETEFIPGHYTLKMNLSVEGGKTYKFEKDFEITKKSADYYNKSAVMDQENSSNKLGYILGLVILLLLILLLIGYLIMRRRLQQLSDKENKK